jgi:glycerol-3-phosphate O-acyltransferase
VIGGHLLDRVGPRRMPDAVAQLLGARWYAERLAKSATDLGPDLDSVRAEAASYVREMAASPPAGIESLT